MTEQPGDVEGAGSSGEDTVDDTSAASENGDGEASDTESERD